MNGSKYTCNNCGRGTDIIASTYQKFRAGAAPGPVLMLCHVCNTSVTQVLTLELDKARMERLNAD